MPNTKQYYHLMFKNYPDVLSVDELIDVLKISKKTVYKLLKDNKIKHIKTGREYRIPKIYVIDYLLAS